MYTQQGAVGHCLGMWRYQSLRRYHPHHCRGCAHRDTDGYLSGWLHVGSPGLEEALSQ